MPRIVPLSRLSGATPTSAATAWRLIGPSSGRHQTGHCRAEQRAGGLGSDAGDAGEQRFLPKAGDCRFKPARRLLDQPVEFVVDRVDLFFQHLPDGLDAGLSFGRDGLGPMEIGDCRAVALGRVPFEELLAAREQIDQRCGLGIGQRTQRGLMLAPKRASTAASIASVLARMPTARAKSRTCPGNRRLAGGLTTTTGSPAAARAATTAR